MQKKQSELITKHSVLKNNEITTDTNNYLPPEMKLDDDLEALHKKHLGLNNKYIKLAKKTMKLNSTIASVKSDNIKAQNEIFKNQKQINQLQNQNQLLLKNLNEETERIKQQQQLLTNNKHQINLLENEKQLVEKQLEEMTETKKKQQQLLIQLKNQITELEENQLLNNSNKGCSSKKTPLFVVIAALFGIGFGIYLLANNSKNSTPQKTIGIILILLSVVTIVGFYLRDQKVNGNRLFNSKKSNNDLNSSSNSLMTQVLNT